MVLRWSEIGKKEARRGLMRRAGKGRTVKSASGDFQSADDDLVTDGLAAGVGSRRM